MVTAYYAPNEPLRTGKPLGARALIYDQFQSRSETF